MTFVPIASERKVRRNERHSPHPRNRKLRKLGTEYGLDVVNELPIKLKHNK